MPGCCVKGCNNRSEKGFKLFNVPVDKKRREEWLQLIRRDTLTKKAAVCKVHFDEDQFEQHREDGKKLLRPFGKPNLLDKHTVNQQQDNSEQTTDPSNVQNIISYENESNATSNENNSCSVNGDDTNREITTNEDVCKYKT
ncbi:unnamed protein product [Lasius platythorax]|uniref:THAP-type domain-containing protein n=1 Tax=Lasius platythorax TaxID=488582 RepID=A0AAV2MXX2_9HYME